MVDAALAVVVVVGRVRWGDCVVIAVARVVVRGSVVEAAAQELPGGCEPVVGLEAGEAAPHDVDEEADGDTAVVGLLANDLGKAGCELAVGGWRVLGAAPPLRGRCVLVDEVLSLGESELDELSRGGDPMGWLGVLELSLHGGDEEADDESSIVGLLSDDFLYRRSTLAFGVFLLFVLQGVVGVFCGEHMR